MTRSQMVAFILRYSPRRSRRDVETWSDERLASAVERIERRVRGV